MNDRELLREFVRVERTEKEVQILVREIRWEGSHTPVSTWAIAQDLPGTATEADVDAEAARTIQDERYFRVCRECDERNPVGWMHNASLCQGCAEANHGIVY